MAANQRSAFSLSLTLALYISNGFGLRLYQQINKHFSDAISKRHFQLDDDVYADYVENLLTDISKEPNDASNFAYGDDSKYEW